MEIEKELVEVDVGSLVEVPGASGREFWQPGVSSEFCAPRVRFEQSRSQRGSCLVSGKYTHRLFRGKTGK